MTTNMLKRRPKFTPRQGEIIIVPGDPPRSWARTIVLVFLVAVVLVQFALATGCCDEQQRAVYQCADEHARCRAVIDALCETDDAYCPEDERTSPFSRRTSAMGECDRAYELCWLTATTTRTPDRFARMDGGAL